MWPTPKTAFLLLAAHSALLASANPVEQVGKRQSCPEIHVFGARETTVSPGYGSSASVVNAVINAYSGTTSEAITYPACGGQSSCGGIAYGDSAAQGTSAVAAAVNNFHTQCPDTKLVLVGYSQGGQIMDNAFCGGGDPGAGISDTSIPISASAQAAVKAAIFMGDPRAQYGLAYQVGTCRAGGFDARSASFTCPNAAKVQSYCDSPDPYCCNGNDANHHQQYGTIYGADAIDFIKSKIDASSVGGGGGGGSSTSTTTSGTTEPTSGGSVRSNPTAFLRGGSLSPSLFPPPSPVSLPAPLSRHAWTGRKLTHFSLAAQKTKNRSARQHGDSAAAGAGQELPAAAPAPALTTTIGTANAFLS
ncbi:hypothetical protein MKZ38_003606 [Zalerion maritima]|uniref:Acetylxylan esterase n=1 Tax=Zalerion maritima TaxID=339359 RepID=A0AAD5WRM2_9PEZI|nr:hypothetical protein MKZ38_003606 [Zalerion maritima]